MSEVRQEILDTHNASRHNRGALLCSDTAGCFYCTEIFKPEEVKEWALSGRGGPPDDALCPKCVIDSVLASSSGFPITEKFLKELHEYWFDRTVPLLP
jgi:hypothetical protein